MADERTFRTFEIGWGNFDIDLQACGEGEELSVEQALVQEVSDKCDDIAEAKCSFCYDPGSIKLSEEQQAEGQAYDTCAMIVSSLADRYEPYN